MPENTVYVGRGSRWGNPFVVNRTTTPEQAVKMFAEYMLPYTHHGARNSLSDFYYSQANIEDIVAELKGKNLACWCKPQQPCHADLLLDIANRDWGCRP